MVKDETTDEVSFLMKGADTVMSAMVQYNDWLEEECSNMAREGVFKLNFSFSNVLYKFIFSVW